MKKATIAFLLTCTAVFAQQTGTFTDSRDKKKYKTVNIGGFTWMAENLNYNSEGSKCYDNKPANCTKYGRLYDWETAMKACPEGWRLPAPEEWIILQHFADDDEAIGMNGVSGKNLKAKSGWDKNRNENGNGMDKYGFSALPGGHFSNFFNEVGKCGLWWGDNKGSTASVCYNADFFSVSSVPAVPVDKLVSIRCLKGTKEEAVAAQAALKAAIQRSSFTDSRNNKAYKTIKIGEQTWMAENLNYDAEGSKCYDDKPENCEKYGRLYNWVTAMDIDAKFNNEKWSSKDAKHKGVCPDGWHLPTRKEWRTLENSVGSYRVAGKELKAASGWNECKGEKKVKNKVEKYDACGTDEYGFSALPGGWGGGRYNSGKFYNVGEGGFWWSASGYRKNELNIVDAHSNKISSDSELINWEGKGKTDLISVRCVQD